MKKAKQKKVSPPVYTIHDVIMFKNKADFYERKSRRLVKAIGKAWGLLDEALKMRCDE
jgi:hypothetical protein